LYTSTCTLVAALAMLTILACGEGSTDETNGAVAQQSTARNAQKWPMPSIESRIDAVIRQIEPQDWTTIRSNLEGSRPPRYKDRRRILRKLTPRTRGVLHRHRVRLMHIAKHLNRGAQ